jgi:hypothetical protein
MVQPLGCGTRLSQTLPKTSGAPIALTLGCFTINFGLVQKLRFDLAWIEALAHDSIVKVLCKLFVPYSEHLGVTIIKVTNPKNLSSVFKKHI